MPLFTSEYVFSDDYPTIEPSLKLDFANARALDPRITFTRASTATYVGRDGLVKYAGEDEARFDHDPTTGESLGLLIEESRTNLITNSVEFSNASWSKVAANIQSNATTSPAGDLTADKIYDDTTSGTQHYTTQSFSKEATTYTGSVYVKAAEYTKLAVGFTGVANWQGIPQALFDLVSEEAALLGADTTATINSVGNGWYRVSITSTSLNTTASALTLSHVSDSGTNTGGGNIFLGHDGDGSSGVYIWGAQVEAGGFPTSYIPTSGSTATRGQEKALISGESFNSFFNSTEGFIMGTYKLNGVNTGTDWQTLVTIDNKTASNRMWIYARGGGDITQWIGSSGGTTQFTPALGANATAGVERTVGGAYALNDMIGVYEGTLTAPDTNALLPVGVDRMGIGYRDDTSTAFINGTIKKLFYYPKRLTNTQLQTLTQ
jgi:hypothetical protein